MDCQHEHLLRDCGPHANQFFQSHLNRMAGSLLNEHCVLFTYGSNACTFNRNSGESLMLYKCNMFGKVFSAVLFGLFLLVFR